MAARVVHATMSILTRNKTPRHLAPHGLQACCRPAHFSNHNRSCSQRPEEAQLRYLHTMVRVTDVEKSLDFYCNKLGMREVRRTESEAGRFTLIFLAAPEDTDRATAGTRSAAGTHLQLGSGSLRRRPQFRAPGVRGGRHLCHLRPADESGRHDQPARRATAAWPSSARPTTSPSSCCRKRDSLPKQEPWASMANTGKW